MVLGNFQYWDVLLIRIFIGQGPSPTVLAAGPSKSCLGRKIEKFRKPLDRYVGKIYR